MNMTKTAVDKLERCSVEVIASNVELKPSSSLSRCWAGFVLIVIVNEIIFSVDTISAEDHFLALYIGKLLLILDSQSSNLDFVWFEGK